MYAMSGGVRLCGEEKRSSYVRGSLPPPPGHPPSSSEHLADEVTKQGMGCTAKLWKGPVRYGDLTESRPRDAPAASHLLQLIIKR